MALVRRGFHPISETKMSDLLHGHNTTSCQFSIKVVPYSGSKATREGQGFALRLSAIIPIDFRRI